MDKKLRIAFFGTPDIAVWVLDELKASGIIPDLLITNPDRPQGRKLALTPPPAKDWAIENGIEVFQPESISENDELSTITSREWDLFIVVAYGLIMPKWLIDLPKHGTLNIHPSLLPKLRGASPIRSAILENMRDTGVTIMQMDEKLDHGPVVAQQKIDIDSENWPIRGSELDQGLARLGGSILSVVIPKWISGDITPIEQNHEEATFCKKIEKSDGELHIDPGNLPTGDEAYETLLKIRAYDGWPGTFFMNENKRIKITDAELSSEGQLRILRVIPEGKKEIDFNQYLNRI